MQLLGNLDIRTLMVCIALTTALFAYAFFRTWGTHRSLRGSGSFALAYLIATVTAILIAFVPDTAPAPRFFNIVLGDTFALVIYALLLTGIEQFFGARRLMRIGWFLIFVALTLNIYFTGIHDSIVGRLLVNGIFTAVFRLLLGIDVLRQPHRKHLRTLAVLMFLFAAFSLIGVWDIFTHPNPHNAEEWLRSQGVQSIAVFLQFVFILAIGQILFLLLNGELVRQVEDEASRDFITGTLNRRGIERALITEMGRSARFALPLAVALVDIDGFKQINDTLGHAEGDRTLLAVSRSIQRSLRAYDSVGRFGGDEFLILLPNSTAPEALRVMERVRHEVAAISADSATLSIGVTSMHTPEPHTDLIARADHALYAAKQDGRNCTRMSLTQTEDLITAETPLDLA
jgi:diguanylate cyclase (GGDEF)-like protein